MIHASLPVPRVPAQHPQSPEVRLFIPDGALPAAGAEGLTPALRYSELYREHDRPRRLGAGLSPLTVSQDDETIGLWAALTGDPPVADVTPATMRQFAEQLSVRMWRGETISVNTVRKHVRHMQRIIDLAGPKTRANPAGLDLLSQLPDAIQAPPAEHKLPNDRFLSAEIWLLLEASPSPWWRNLLLFAYNTGLRIGAILQVRWEMLDASEPGWLAVPNEISKRHKGGVYYLNRWAREAAEATWGTAKGRRTGAIFAGFDHWPRGKSSFYTQFRGFRDGSGLDRQRRFAFHALRKGLATWAGTKNLALARIILGHRGNDVTLDCYIDPAEVSKLMDQVPQPGPPMQQYLF